MFWLSGDFLVLNFCNENTHDEWCIVIKACKFIVLDILRVFSTIVFCVFCVSTLSLHIESTDSKIIVLLQCLEGNLVYTCILPFGFTGRDFMVVGMLRMVLML